MLGTTSPLKDTSGPALSIVMKLLAALSLVFADSFDTLFFFLSGG